MICRSEPVQITLDGREEPVSGPVRPVTGVRRVEVLPLFDPGAFCPDVPGTLALPTDE